MNSWFWIDSGKCDAAFNMALDEALLETAPRRGRPVLRFYGWTKPAASFGYFQKFAEVERATRLRPIVRRPTAGGIVPHAADWTYSLIFPPNDPWYGLRATESYRRAHEWIQGAFMRLSVQTDLAPRCRKAAPGQCFEGWERFDLLWQGRKIAGAAQRRTRHGLLIQGSVQPPPIGLARADWQKAMCDEALARFGVGWEILDPGPDLSDRAEQLAREKYSQPAYNQKR